MLFWFWYGLVTRFLFGFLRGSENKNFGNVEGVYQIMNIDYNKKVLLVVALVLYLLYKIMGG